MQGECPLIEEDAGQHRSFHPPASPWLRSGAGPRFALVGPTVCGKARGRLSCLSKPGDGVVG